MTTDNMAIIVFPPDIRLLQSLLEKRQENILCTILCKVHF